MMTDHVATCSNAQLTFCWWCQIVLMMMVVMMMMMMMMMLFSVDVDVAEPDEKSLITYVSSLYDVFPDVPSMEQSLRDSVCVSLY